MSFKHAFDEFRGAWLEAFDQRCPLFGAVSGLLGMSHGASGIECPKKQFRVYLLDPVHKGRLINQQRIDLCDLRTDPPGLSRKASSDLAHVDFASLPEIRRARGFTTGR